MIRPENDHCGPTNPFRPGMGLDPPYLVPLFGDYLRRNREAG